MKARWVAREVDCEGQTLVEFILCSVVALGVLASVSNSLWTHWRRARCAFIAFDTAQSVLMRTSVFSARRGVHIQQDRKEVRVSVKCGEDTHSYEDEERVALAKLR